MKINRRKLIIISVVIANLFLLTTTKFIYAKEKRSKVVRTNAGRDRGFGLGGILGTPNGLILKYHLNSIKALDGAVGIYKDQVEIHSTYLWHLKNIISSPNWLPYIGPGLTLRVGGSENERQEVGTNPKGKPIYENVSVDKDAVVALRGAFGLLFKYKKWEPFFELAPHLIITPDAKFTINISIGVIYYLK